MANHKNAEKSIRRTKRRTTINMRRRSIMRTAVRKAEVGLGLRIVHGQAPKAAPQDLALLIVEAESKIMRAAQQGIISKKSASRKVSRLTHRLRKAAANA